jgi:hypothetical protein
MFISQESIACLRNKSSMFKKKGERMDIRKVRHPRRRCKYWDCSNYMLC